MILSFWKKKTVDPIVTSELFNERSFYKNFLKDLKYCKEEVIIESPYITSNRMEHLIPIFQALLEKGIKIHIITRDPSEHEENIRYQATNEILCCKEMGINIILMRGHHHRKIAIIDKRILWEDSLNILSYAQSKEVMRRIEGGQTAREMFHFLGLSGVI